MNEMNDLNTHTSVWHKNQHVIVLWMDGWMNEWMTQEPTRIAQTMDE
jgi:hypothetical protein